MTDGSPVTDRCPEIDGAVTAGGAGVASPDGAQPAHWFEPVADRMGAAYDRYAHTKGWRQEVDHLVAALGLQPGERVLDVGCGTGRHAHELARRGLRVHGVDLSRRFVELARAAAPAGATFERVDARALAFEGDFDAAICLCQGAFGMMVDPADDDRVLAGIARALRPGGQLALSAFNAYFGVRYHTAATLDAATGVAHERTEVRDEAGRTSEIDLWTRWFTPAELAAMLERAGFDVRSISAAEPGAYGRLRPDVEHPEFLVIARRPW